MSLMTDYLFILGFCSSINSLIINQKDHKPGITSHYKYVEKYQLLGGKSRFKFHINVGIVCGGMLNYLLMCAITAGLFPQSG